MWSMCLWAGILVCLKNRRREDGRRKSVTDFVARKTETVSHGFWLGTPLDVVVEAHHGWTSGSHSRQEYGWHLGKNCPFKISPTYTWNSYFYVSDHNCCILEGLQNTSQMGNLFSNVSVAQNKFPIWLMFCKPSRCLKCLATRAFSRIAVLFSCMPQIIHIMLFQFSNVLFDTAHYIHVLHPYSV